ncbi:MAG: ABC transporter ATP-binding protein [Betaproteobacteria bacterium]
MLAVAAVAPVDTTIAAAAAPPILTIERLSKFYTSRDTRTGGTPGRITALSSISANVRRGEFISLLGPSGCGKTTLLRIAAGLTGWDEGTISIAGARIDGPRKDACMVFQHFGLLPWRTVLANVVFPLELDGMAKGASRERAMELLKLVGLEQHTEHFPHELSGGMQQRVGIARALMRKPLMLFMDEPFGALDAQTRERLQEDFLKIWAAVGTTVLFVTHSIDEALVMSDRIFVFTPSPGRIKAIVDSPLAGERIGGDPRAHRAYGTSRNELRHMLSGSEP